MAVLAGQYGHDTPHRDAQMVRRQRLNAELFGYDGAGPVDEVRQIIAEIEFGRARHEQINPRERRSI